MKHIGMKLFLAFISMALLTIGVLWIIQAGFMRDIYQRQRIAAVNSAVGQFSGSSEADYAGLAESLNMSLLVVDSSGTVKYRSASLPMQGMMQRTILSLVPDGADGQPHYLNAMSGTNRYVALGQKTDTGLYIFAIFSLADLDEAARLVRQQLWLITLILVALSIGLAIWLSRRLSRPIRAVTGAARELAAGHLQVRLPVRGQDEISQLTEALNDLGAELGRTEELRKELIANVSHELRAPLAVIQGYAEIVRDVSWPDETKRTSQLNIIADEASRLTRVVKDILDYSRLQAGVERPELREVPICQVLDLLKTRYEIEAARRQVDIRIECQGQTVLFDRDRLDQLLHNLMNNAINHARSGTAVEIRVTGPTGNHSAGNSLTAERQPANRSFCRVEVGNSGEPIPAEDLPRIWERYYRADRTAAASDGARPLGTGLGLAIVRSICEQHGVNYGVRSGPEQTVFWFEAQQAAGEGQKK